MTSTKPAFAKCVLVGLDDQKLVQDGDGMFVTTCEVQRTSLGGGDPIVGRSRKHLEYYAKWACGHYTAPFRVSSNQPFSIAKMAEACKLRAGQPAPAAGGIVITNIVGVEQCEACAAFDEDAEVVFRQRDEEDQQREA